MKNQWHTGADNQINVPNLLLISGSGRKVGKTWLACILIRKWKKHVPVAAIKISRHRHDLAYQMKQMVSGEGFVIWKELDTSWKDTGKFVEAGAFPVLYIETEDQHLFHAFKTAMNLIGENQLIICESGELVNFVKPVLVIFIQSAESQTDSKKLKIRDMADLVVPSGKTEYIVDQIKISDNTWRLIH